MQRPDFGSIFTRVSWGVFPSTLRGAWLQWHKKLPPKTNISLEHLMVWKTIFLFETVPIYLYCPFQGRHFCAFSRGGFYKLSPGKDHLKHILGCLVRFDTPRHQTMDIQVCFVNSGPMWTHNLSAVSFGIWMDSDIFLPRNRGIRSAEPQIS